MIEDIKSVVRRFVKPRLHKTNLRMHYELFGNRNARFPLMPAEMNSDSLIYSFGIGEDVSFEISAINRFGCSIHGFDPTPKSIAWINDQAIPENFKVHQIGIGGEDTEVTFFPPENTNYVSYSVNPASGSDTSKAVVSQVMRLQSIIKKLGTRLPDVVRMNVEGFEYQASQEIIKSGLRPKQLVIEFHHGMYGIKPQETLRAVEMIQQAGYRIFYISDHGRDYGFVHLPG